MSPKPFTENSQHEYSTTCDCKHCQTYTRYRRNNPHLYGYGAREVTPKFHRPSANTLICTLVIIACILAAAWIWTDAASARSGQTQPQPIAAPPAMIKARAQCRTARNTETCLRGALRRAYDAVSWQQHARLALAREMVGKLTDWTCIHQGEGAWNSHTGNGYYGGLQMDAQFERTYGRDMLQRYHGHADRWPPRKQIIVAQRAYAQNRGYNPWPTTARRCGLIR